ncbi:ParM/StbA family protein [Thioalkalivibrio sp. ALgr3]|uniref:ParM/StbA family protein n=1 Tax=Thioalkalivibrio sp. ALgr3 TaxID=1239292 RepID=UPI00035F92AF|nr:ParM/StbA family protein [Thioalkalivibrio sp. ALgr3]
MATQVIGLDIGHSAVKMTFDKANSVNRYMFPSVAAPAIHISNSEEAQRAARETVKVRGREYFIGETASIQARGSVAAGLTREWLQSNEHMALMAHANRIAGEDADAFSHRIVVLGLPVTEFDQRRDPLKEIAAEVFGDGVQIRVMPQPMGTYQSVMLARTGLPAEGRVMHDESWGVIDVGYYSTDIMVLVNGRWVEAGSGGGPGVYVAAQALERILRDHDIEADIFEAEKALREGTLKQYGQRIDVQDHVAKALGTITNQVIDTANQLMQSHAKHLDGILVTGGGGSLVLDQLQAKWPHASMAEDTEAEGTRYKGHRFANSEGYYRFGRMTDRLGQKAKA